MMNLILMSDCRNFSVTADVVLTILTIYTCSITYSETGFLNCIVIFCIYVIFGINFCLEDCCFNRAFYISEVL